VKRLLAVVAIALAVAPACQLQGLAFIEDRRVELVSPEYREIVGQPVTIDWEVTDDALAEELGSGTQFGVYMDIDPQPPGEPLEYFGRDDPTCRRSPTCPDEKYLRQRGVYTTTDTEMTFRFLPVAPGVDLEQGDPDFHEVTLVLLDEEGQRIGESAWAIIFEVGREGG
jgi:hypothetical protein